MDAVLRLLANLQSWTVQFGQCEEHGGLWDAQRQGRWVVLRGVGPLWGRRYSDVGAAQVAVRFLRSSFLDDEPLNWAECPTCGGAIHVGRVCAEDGVL